jgi:hypothetical protein
MGKFVEHLVGISKKKGCKTLLNSNPTPCKNLEIQHRRDTHKPYTWFVRVNNKKWGKMNKIRWKWVFMKNGEELGNWRKWE